MNISTPNKPDKKIEKDKKKGAHRTPGVLRGLRTRETPKKIFSDNVQEESSKMRQGIAQKKGERYC